MDALPRRRTVIKARPRRAATAVELAVVSPMFFLLVFALVEFSRMVMVQQALTNAAREGARKGALATTQNQSDVDGAVRSHLSAAIPNSSNSGECRISTSPAVVTSAPSGTIITVTVEVDFSDVSWFNSPWFLGSSKLHGRATMERE